MDMFKWIILGIIVVIIVVFFLIPNHTVFQCPKCKKTFVPKKLEMLGPHSFGKQMLKCPHCGQRIMMEQVGKQE